MIYFLLVIGMNSFITLYLEREGCVTNFIMKEESQNVSKKRIALENHLLVDGSGTSEVSISIENFMRTFNIFYD